MDGIPIAMLVYRSVYFTYIPAYFSKTDQLWMDPPKKDI